MVVFKRAYPPTLLVVFLDQVQWDVSAENSHQEEGRDSKRYSQLGDGSDPQTVHRKSIVPDVPRSGAITGRHVIGATARGPVRSNKSRRFLACQYVALSNIANGWSNDAAFSMNSAASEKGGFVIIAPRLTVCFRKSTPPIP